VDPSHSISFFFLHFSLSFTTLFYSWAGCRCGQGLWLVDLSFRFVFSSPFPFAHWRLFVNVRPAVDLMGSAGPLDALATSSCGRPFVSSRLSQMQASASLIMVAPHLWDFDNLALYYPPFWPLVLDGLCQNIHLRL
jgi:hypothetical protein